MREAESSLRTAVKEILAASHLTAHQLNPVSESIEDMAAFHTGNIIRFIHRNVSTAQPLDERRVVSTV